MSGRLAIGASGAARAYLWAAIYNDFGRRYPAVPLDLKPTGSTENSFDRASAGELDIALAVQAANATSNCAQSVFTQLFYARPHSTHSRGGGPVTAKSLA